MGLVLPLAVSGDAPQMRALEQTLACFLPALEPLNSGPYRSVSGVPLFKGQVGRDSIG